MPPSLKDQYERKYALMEKMQPSEYDNMYVREIVYMYGRLHKEKLDAQKAIEDAKNAAKTKFKK